MPKSFEQFMSSVQPWMLGEGGKFLGPQSGVNFMFEGMTPQQAYDFSTDRFNRAEAERKTSEFGWNMPQTTEDFDPAWRPGAVSTASGALGNWGVPLAMLTAAVGGGALLGGASAGEGALAAGATEGGLGFSPTAAGFNPAADSLAASNAGWTTASPFGSLGTGTYGLETDFGFPGSVLSKDSVLTTPGLTGAAPYGTLGGATDATGAMIGSGTATEGAEALAATTKPGLSGTNLFSDAVKGVLGGALNTALAPDPQKAINAADPFSTQRAQYQPQLQAMMQGKFTPADPSYSWRFGQGMEAVNRSAAASGMLNSGNRLTALMNYGQSMASTEYQNQFNRLAQLSGANFSPGAAGQIASGQAAQQQAGTNAVVGGLTDFIGKLYDSWGK